MKNKKATAQVTVINPALLGVPRNDGAKAFSSLVEETHAGIWPKVTSICTSIDWNEEEPKLLYEYCSDIVDFNQLTKTQDDEGLYEKYPLRSGELEIRLAGLPRAPSWEKASCFLTGRTKPPPPLRERIPCDYAAHLLAVIVNRSKPDIILGCGSASLRVEHISDQFHAVAHLGLIRVAPHMRGLGLAKAISGNLGGLLGERVATLQNDTSTPAKLTQTVVCHYAIYEQFHGIFSAFTFSYAENAPNQDIEIEDEDQQQWNIEAIQSELDGNLPHKLPRLPAILAHPDQYSFDEDLEDEEEEGIYDFFDSLPDDRLGPTPPGMNVPETLTFHPSDIYKVETTATEDFMGLYVSATTYWSKPSAIEAPRDSLFPEAITDVATPDGVLVAQIRWCLLLITESELAMDILDESSDTDKAFGSSIFTDGGFRRDAVAAWGDALRYPNGFGLIEHLFVAPLYRGGAMEPLLRWFLQNIAPTGYPMVVVDRTWHNERKDAKTIDPIRLQARFRSLRLKQLQLPQSLRWRPEFYAFTPEFFKGPLKSDGEPKPRMKPKLRTV